MLKSRSCLPPGFAMTKMKRPVERLISRGSKPYRRIEISSTSTRGKGVCCPAIFVMRRHAFVSIEAGDDVTVSDDIKQLVAVSPTSIETKAGLRITNIAGQQTPLPRVEVEEISIRRYGFEPREISRSTGRFILVIANPGGKQDLDFSIHREAGEKLQSMQLPRNQRDWNDSLVLAPGRYVLSEASHPNWLCRINIR